MTATTDALALWRELAEKPIRSDAPCGDPVRDDAEFERLQAEMRKLDSVSPQPVAWAEAVRMARALLDAKSKDLLVSSYLCMGLFEQDGYPGLAAGMTHLDALIARWWVALFPEAKRMRGRVNALVWLVEKLDAAVGRKAPRSSDADALQAIADALRALQASLTDKLGPDAPSFGPLRRAIEARREELTTPGPTLEIAVEAPAAGGASEPTGMPSGPIATDDECERTRRQGVELALRAAEYARGKDQTVAWPYRLARALTWLEIDAAPEHAEGVTRVPPPPAHLTEHLARLHEQKSWPELAAQAEAQVGEWPFWLDLHRYVAGAFGRLGAEYEGARSAVTGEVVGLVRRLPSLLECRFADGTPFADEETGRWLRAEQGAASAGGFETAPAREASGGSDERDIAEIKAKAYALLREGEPREAIDIFQREVRGVAPARRRFLLRYEMALVCADAGQERIALSLLEELDQDIRARRLDEWEPDLSLDVWLSTWKIVDRVRSGSDAQAVEWTKLAETIFARLARVDALSAVDLGKG